MVTVNMTIPDEWVAEANERDIPNTRYVGRMARAGRRQFGLDYEPDETPTEPTTLKQDETSTRDVEQELKDWIAANLSTNDPQEISDLVNLLEGDFEELMSDLMDEEKVTYKPGKGYLRVNDE
jgi:uncharacterized protein YcaQ